MAAYLAQRDLSGFNPYATPRATAAFFEAVNVSQPQEDAELANVFSMTWRRTKRAAVPSDRLLFVFDRNVTSRRYAGMAA